MRPADPAPPQSHAAPLLASGHLGARLVAAARAAAAIHLAQRAATGAPISALRGTARSAQPRP